MHSKHWKFLAGSALSAALLAAPLTALPAAAEVPAAPGVVINEAYLSGGSTGAAFRNKFVELYNNSDAAVNLGGWSLQYRSGTGTSAPSGITSLSGSIPAKGHFLIKEPATTRAPRPRNCRPPTSTGPAPSIPQAPAEPSSWPSRQRQ